MRLTENLLLIGTQNDQAFRFREVTIPVGATIESAVLSIYPVKNATKPISIRFVGEAVGH